MTPLHIAIALHYYEPRDGGVVFHSVRDAEAAARIHRDFIDAGLLELAGDNNHLKATDKLRLYIEEICKVPHPDEQPLLSADEHYSYADIVQEKNIGDATIKTRNAIIARVVDKYRADTPLAMM
jgi:hypothetical protein